MNALILISISKIPGSIEETARKAFEEGASAAGLPTVEIARNELEAGIGVLGLYVTAGLCASNGETRRNIKGGAVKVNDKAVTDHSATI